MKCSVNVDELAKDLAIVSRATPSRSTIPVLSHVLVEGRDNTLYLSATDLNIAISCAIGVDIEGEGGLSVPAHLFRELVSTLDGPLTLEIGGNELTIGASRNTSHIVGFPPVEFPAVAGIEGDAVSVEFAPEVMLSLLNRVVFAAAKNESRPALTGVLFAAGGREISAVATDGFRLSEVVVKSEWDIDEIRSLIPARTFAELLRVLRVESDAAVKMTLTTGRVAFDVGRFRLSSCVLDYPYPEYKGYLPSGWKTRFVIAPGTLFRAVKAVSAFSTVGRDRVPVVLKVTETDVEVEALSEVDTSSTKVSADVEGDSVTFALHAEFLLEALRVFSSEVVFEIAAPSSPIILRPLSGAVSFFHMIMPMSLGGA